MEQICRSYGGPHCAQQFVLSEIEKEYLRNIVAGIHRTRILDLIALWAGCPVHGLLPFRGDLAASSAASSFILRYRRVKEPLNHLGYLSWRMGLDLS
jgi:hypothetical protein